MRQLRIAPIWEDSKESNVGDDGTNVEAVRRSSPEVVRRESPRSRERERERAVGGNELYLSAKKGRQVGLVVERRL